jgi:hypothetical protein
MQREFSSRGISSGVLHRQHSKCLMYLEITQDLAELATIFAHTVDHEGHSGSTPFAELHVESRITKQCSELTPEDAASANAESVEELLRLLGMPVFSVCAHVCASAGACVPVA